MTVITGVIIAATTIALCSILFPNKPAPKPMSDEQKLAALIKKISDKSTRFVEIRIGAAVVGYRAIFPDGSSYEDTSLTTLCNEIWMEASGIKA